MRPLARLVPLLALIAVSVVAWLALRTRNGPGPWQALPGGGEVRVLAVTHGTQHTVDVGGQTWRDRFRAAWRERSLRLMAKSPTSVRTFTTRCPSLLLWLEGRDVPLPELAVLVLPDGQGLWSETNWGGPSSTGQGWGCTISFPALPARAKTLRFIAQTVAPTNGARWEVSAQNPAYRTDLPVWKGEPLPQMRRHGDVALTLRAIKTFAGSWPESPAPRPLAQPVWTVTRNGEPADESYDIRASFEDPAGNAFPDVGLFSEPVWKIRASVSRTERFPFSDEEVRWLGSIDPAAAELTEAAAHALLPLGDDGRAGKLKLVGIFAPGHFEINDLVVTHVGPPGHVSPGAAARWDHRRKVHVLRLDRPALIVLEAQPSNSSEPSDLQLLRDEHGAIVRIPERGFSVGGREMFSSGRREILRIFDLPDKQVRIGFASSAPFELEFLVAAPQRPF